MTKQELTIKIEKAISENPEHKEYLEIYAKVANQLSDKDFELIQKYDCKKQLADMIERIEDEKFAEQVYDNFVIDKYWAAKELAESLI